MNEKALKMRSFKAMLSVLVIALMPLYAIAATSVHAKAETSSADYVPNQILVKYKAGISAAARSVNRRSMRAAVKQQFSKFAVEQWSLPGNVSVEAAVKQLQADPNIEFAEPNYRRYPRAIPNDPSFSQQWAMQNTGQTINGAVVGAANADMNLVTAWNTTTGSANVIVAVIDDSVDITHPDLATNIWSNAGEIAGNSIDDDGNGYIDDVNGWDFLNRDNDPSADVGTAQGHGSSVAGCIGAVGNNAVGITGVNWAVSIMPLKFGFDVASELAAMQYAIDNGAHIVNASWGGPQYSIAESGGIQLLQNAGILLVVAAGNYDTNNDFVPDYPSSLVNPNILSVAASTPTDTLAAWSHYGATSVDVAAPGETIYTLGSPITGTAYSYLNGTSFSSPYVAGIAALIKANKPTATYQEMKGRILAAVDPQATMQGSLSSGGRANAANALAVAAQPVIMVRSATWVDGGNGWPDAGETLDLSVVLENVWQAATAVSATLVSLSPNLSVNNANASYPDLATSAFAASVAPFQVQVAGTATGYQVYKLRLDIAAAGGYTVSRYYTIGLGTLQNGVVYNGTLMSDVYDDVQVFHIDVPAGATNLSFSTTSAQDIDLLVNPTAPAKFDYQLYNAGGINAGTLVAAGITGSETIAIPVPTSTGYYVTVLDAPPASNTYAFTLVATFTPLGGVAPAPAAVPVAASAGGGGGCTIASSPTFDPTLLLLVLISMLYLRRHHYR